MSGPPTDGGEAHAPAQESGGPAAGSGGAEGGGDAPEKRRWTWRRLLGWAVASAPLFFALGLVGANLYLMGPGKARIEGRLTHAVGAVTQIESARWTPWGGMVLRGVEIPNPPMQEGVLGEPFLRIDEVLVEVDLASVLTDNIEIPRVVCEGFTVSALRRKDGAVALPTKRGTVTARVQDGFMAGGGKAVPDPAAGQGDPATPGQTPGDSNADPDPGDPPAADPGGADPSVAAAPQTPASGAGDPKATPAAPPPQGRTISIGEISIQRGSARLRDEATGLDAAELNGAEFFLKLGGGAGKTEARARVAEVLLLGAPVAKGIESPAVLMQNGALRLPAITGDFLGGGELTGQADVDLTRPGVPFKIDLTVKGGHLGALPKALLPADEVRGDVEGRLALSGYAEALETLQGGGLIRCADITAARSPDLDAAAAGAGEEKLKELAVDSAAALFQIAHRVVAVRDLTVKSEHAMLRALGQVAFDGRLNINARLYLTPEALGVAQRVEARLPPEQRLGFRALEDTDWHYRDTLVRGTAGQPAADLRGTGELRPLRDEIQALFAAEPAG